MKVSCLFSVVFIIAFSFSSCSSPAKKENSETGLFKLYRENFFNDIRDPEKLMAMVVPGAGEFDSTLLNDGKEHISYTNNEIKSALNLGVYLSDLNYAFLFDRSSACREFFHASVELGKATGLEQTTLQFLSKRYEAHLNEHDSIKAIVSDLFRTATGRLEGTEKERIAGLAMAGYQVENLHLALATISQIPDNATEEQIKTREELKSYVASQGRKWEIIYNFLNSHADLLDPDRNPNYPFFNNLLREILTIYKAPASQLDLVQLREKIELVRSKIIAP